MNWIIKSAQSAFGSWTMVAGMFIGGVTVFNFLQRALKIGLSEIFHRILDAYRAVFHTLFDWLTFWIPFEVPWWVKDATVVWVVLWGAMARILWVIYSTELRARGKGRVSLGQEIPLLGRLFSRGFAVAGIAFVLSILVWPAILALLASRRPHFHTHISGGAPAGIVNGPRILPLLARHYLFDIRVLYLVQITMMFVVACVAIVTNDIIN